MPSDHEALQSGRQGNGRPGSVVGRRTCRVGRVNPEVRVKCVVGSHRHDPQPVAIRCSDARQIESQSFRSTRVGGAAKVQEPDRGLAAEVIDHRREREARVAHRDLPR